MSRASSQHLLSLLLLFPLISPKSLTMAPFSLFTFRPEHFKMGGSHRQATRWRRFDQATFGRFSVRALEHWKYTEVVTQESENGLEARKPSDMDFHKAQHLDNSGELKEFLVCLPSV
jgi:hypothetical protein